MSILSVIADICSLISLVISLFVAYKIVKITNNVNIKGDSNKTAGRDMNNVR